MKKYAKKAKAATAKANNESESIKSQIRAAANILNEMDPVVSIYDPFDTGSDIDDAVKWAIPRIKTTSIERKGYATVLFDEHWIRNGLKYVAKNSNEVAAILAVPQVVMRGIEIGHDPNHKKHGFSTTTFGAPVELNGKRGNMGVVVKVTNPYHYDVHRILTPDGYAFEIPQIENAEPTTEEAQSRKETAVVTPISSASNEIVSHDNTDSQPPIIRKSLKDTDSNGNPLSAGQQQYFSNSAVRNADGQLKVVYHGTDAEFTVFDFMKAGSKVGKAEGYGFYFTANPEVAAHYGNTKAYYLSIRQWLHCPSASYSIEERRCAANPDGGRP